MQPSGKGTGGGAWRQLARVRGQAARLEGQAGVPASLGLAAEQTERDGGGGVSAQVTASCRHVEARMASRLGWAAGWQGGTEARWGSAMGGCCGRVADTQGCANPGLGDGSPLGFGMMGGPVESGFPNSSLGE